MARDHTTRERRSEGNRATGSREAATDQARRSADPNDTDRAAGSAAVRRMVRDAKRGELRQMLSAWKAMFIATVSQALGLGKEVVLADELGEKYVTDKNAAAIARLCEATIDILVGEVAAYLKGAPRTGGRFSHRRGCGRRDRQGTKHGAQSGAIAW
jgi:hypothetical protein